MGAPGRSDGVVISFPVTRIDYILLLGVPVLLSLLPGSSDGVVISFPCRGLSHSLVEIAQRICEERPLLRGKQHTWGDNHVVAITE